MNDLIVVEQLPVIKEKLQEIRKEIEAKVEIANALVCTEDSVKDVKKVRAELSKQFKELEEQRKAVKNAILKPYNEFEAIYKENVSAIFLGADNTLKMKIDSVENELKKVKEEEVKEYFNELKEALHINFLDFEKMGLKVNLSDSVKSLKSKVSEYLEKISQDLILIATQEDKEEILIEYKNSFNVANAINYVKARKQAIEEEKARQELLKKAQDEEEKRVNEVNSVIVENVKEEEIKVDPVYTMTFSVTGTKEQLKAIKNFIIESGVTYGN